MKKINKNLLKFNSSRLSVDKNITSFFKKFNKLSKFEKVDNNNKDIDILKLKKQNGIKKDKARKFSFKDYIKKTLNSLSKVNIDKNIKNLQEEQAVRNNGLPKPNSDFLNKEIKRLQNVKVKLGITNQEDRNFNKNQNMIKELIKNLKSQSSASNHSNKQSLKSNKETDKANKANKANNSDNLDKTDKADKEDKAKVNVDTVLIQKLSKFYSITGGSNNPN